jgi:hypothetical protein
MSEDINSIKNNELNLFIPEEILDESLEDGKKIKLIILEDDREKMEIYLEYVKKMQAMAEETKQIENNMKIFASTIQSLVSGNESNHPSNV